MNHSQPLRHGRAGRWQLSQQWCGVVGTRVMGSGAHVVVIVVHCGTGPGYYCTTAGNHYTTAGNHHCTTAGNHCHRHGPLLLPTPTLTTAVTDTDTDHC